MDTKTLNFLERVLWTLAQALTAEMILSAWEYFRGPIEPALYGMLLVALTTVVSGIKNAAAQALGSPTGSTLGEKTRPVPAEVVVVADKNGTYVAGDALPDVPTGAPIDLVPIPAGETSPEVYEGGS